MRAWWSRRSVGLRTVARMALYLSVAVAAGLALRSSTLTLLLGVAFFVVTVVQHLNARDVTTRAGQQRLFIESHATMRIPPQADRTLWREWLQPANAATPSPGWDRAEQVVAGGALGLSVVVGQGVETPWLIAVILMAGVVFLLGVTAWSRRRSGSKPGYPSDRAYLLAQLDALDSPRDS